MGHQTLWLRGWGECGVGGLAPGGDSWWEGSLQRGGEGLAGRAGRRALLPASGYVLDPGVGGLGWVGRWPEGGQGLDLILKVTGSGKDFNREWELVRSGILEAAIWPCVRVGAGGLPGGVGGSFRSGPGPAFPLSSRARVSSPGPSQILLGAPVPSPEMLAE